MELAEVVKEFTGRELNSENLEQARQKLTRFYINLGYLNSGAILPDQKVVNDRILFRITEGILTEINIKGNERLLSQFIKKRIQRGAGPPLNVHRLQKQLQTLRLNPNISRINAELKPGVSPGQSYLDLAIAEKFPIELTLELNNHRTPSVGAERLRLKAAHNNVFGISDRLDLDYGITKDDLDDFNFAGFDDFEVSYTVPVNSYDTTLKLAFRQSDFSFIEQPFDDLNIESETEEVGFTLSHPLINSYNQQLRLSLTGERRQSKTFLLGRPFDFSEGAEDGISRVTVIRLIQSWVQRSLSSVFAIRSSANFGIDVLHPTKRDGTTRDGKYFSWLGQFQVVHRLGKTSNQLILKNNIQWTDDELPSLEQFSVGGIDSVRGYRENQIVRDRGIVSSIEFRIPLLFGKKGKERLQIAPFFDYGRATNNGSSSRAFKELISAGIGVLLNPIEPLECQLYWGHAFRDVNNDKDDFQDDGFHFAVSFSLF